MTGDHRLAGTPQLGIRSSTVRSGYLERDRPWTEGYHVLIIFSCGGRVRKKRFRGCQGEGQRSAGVRKSIPQRSLLSPFNLMKPLLVKASAWRLAP